MQREDYLKEIKSIFDRCYKITEKKGKDYAKEHDVFYNFKMCEIFGVCLAEEGIVVRMTDKLSRIINLLHKKNDVEDERIEDTIMDLINYSAILLVYLKSKQAEARKYD